MAGAHARNRSDPQGMNRQNPEAGHGREVAVALEYRPDAGSAPTVLAAGFGEIARRILEIARQERIHIHEDDTLAGLLARVPPGREIPEEAYQLVAELLAFLYATDARLAEKMARSGRQKMPPASGRA